MTSDGGGLLRRETDRNMNLLLLFSQCFLDGGDAARIDHSVQQTPPDLKVGDDKGQIIVYQPIDHELADAVENLFRQSLAVHRTSLDF